MVYNFVDLLPNSKTITSKKKKKKIQSSFNFILGVSSSAFWHTKKFIQKMMIKSSSSDDTHLKQHNHPF